MPAKVGKVELHLGPKELGGEDDLRKAIVDFIDGATTRLDIAVQELDDMEIGKAIVAAKQRGVKVSLVLELDYLKQKTPVSDPFQPSGDLETNRVIHDAALRAAIKVNADFNPKIFHQKFIVRDNEALLTGSTNFTTTGVTNNLNHVVIVKDEDAAAVYSKEFGEIQQGHFGRLNEGHDAVPRDVKVSGVPIRILFAPDHNPEMEIMKQMAKAKERVDFAIFTFSKTSGIDDQMILAKSAGIRVRGALDGLAANQSWAATHNLVPAGIELFRVPKQGNLGKLHHKLMVIDKQVVITGSFNYTAPANTLNDENILIIGDLDTTSTTSIAKQRKFGEYAFNEIERIINSFGQPMT